MDDRARTEVVAQLDSLREQDGRREDDGQSRNKVTLKRFSDYSKWIMGLISGTMAAYYPVRELIAKQDGSLDFMVCRSLLFFTFLGDLALMLLTSYLLPLEHVSKRLYIAAKILIYTTGVLMMLTSVSLLLLLTPSYAMVAILVLPNMSIAIMVFYKGISPGQASNVSDYEAYLSELNPFFDLSTSVTVAAFGGMIATIFGYFKNHSKDVDQVVENLSNDDVKFSEAFIFFTVITGLLAMLLTTVPPSLPHPNARSRFITFIKVLSHSLFGLLALVGLAVATEFLEEFILLALFPIFLAVVVWFSMEFIEEDGTSQARSATGHESVPDTSSITSTTFIFSTLMVVYSMHFGSEHNNLHLQTCMFFMASAFMSSLSWMLLAFRSPRTQSLKMAVMVLSYSTIGWSVLALLDVIFLANKSQSGTYHNNTSP